MIDTAASTASSTGANDVTLLMVESTGIQEYIFGSNNLLQNIGASELVARSTSTWIAETLDGLGLSHNTHVRQERGELGIDDRRATGSVQAGGVAVEVIYSGGGNALLLFGPGQAQQVPRFVAALTRRGLVEARGLALVTGSVTCDWDRDVLAAKVRDLRGILAVRKRNRPAEFPLPGLAVTADCVFTGLPAAGANRYGQLVAQEVMHKLAAETPGRQRLHATLPEVGKQGFEFVNDFDQFGERGETSYLAVVHTDGNGMGRRIEQLAEPYSRPDLNRDYLLALRRFSQSVKDNAARALQSTVRLLLDSRDSEGRFGGVVPAPRRGAKYLPFRPIVFGGDDVTFVCEGRLGLALAAHYLASFSDPAQPLADGRPAFARAGVAVTGAHFPFAHAYALADELCASAKRAIPDFMRPPATNAAVLDWHFATSGLLLGLDALREREYTAANSDSLLMRPIRLELGDPPQDGNWRSWRTFCATVQAFQRDEGWKGRRNKIKALRDALRDGPNAVARFVANYAPETGPAAAEANGNPLARRRKLLPLIPGQEDMAEQGWAGGKCGYFDAIEALDFFVALEAGKERV